MAKYIDREAAYRFAQDQIKKETGAYTKGWNNAMNVMKSAFHNNDAIPAADVVPVVRCKECANKFDWPWCGMFPDDGYCSAGVRKDGDGA